MTDFAGMKDNGAGPEAAFGAEAATIGSHGPLEWMRSNRLATYVAVGAAALLTTAALLRDKIASAAPFGTNSSGEVIDYDTKKELNLGDCVDDAVTVLEREDEDNQMRDRIKDIFENPEAYDGLCVSHEDGMQSQLNGFNSENTDRSEMVYGVALSILNDEGYRRAFANAAQGIDPVEPRTDSEEARLAIAKAILTDEDTKFVEDVINGSYDNHGQESEDIVTHDTENYREVEVLRIIPPKDSDFEEIIIKKGGGNDSQLEVCLNIELKKKDGTRVRITGRIPKNPPRRGFNTPRPAPTPAPTPAKRDDGKKPGDGTPAGNSKGQCPTRCDGEAGKGKAGRKPDASGYVTGEDRPNDPPKKKTPPPLATVPDTRLPDAPAATGSAPSEPTGSGEVGEGAEEETPTEDVEF